MTTSEIIRLDTIEALQAYRAELENTAQSIGFVPTMGALHDGHASLIQRSVTENDATIVSIFVNPKQFSPGEDLDSYPRTLERDLERCRDLGVQAIFLPTKEVMYPPSFQTAVDVRKVTEPLDGASRPHFFSGIATVVLKLFLLTRPDHAYFGKKDYQQCLVVESLVRDFNLNIDIIRCPIVREPDGLAMSSRNAYLGPEQRQLAPQLHHMLTQTSQAIIDGEDVPLVLAAGKVRLQEAGFDVDYFELRHPETLDLLTTFDQPAVLFAAAYLGETRLIDNLELSPN